MLCRSSIIRLSRVPGTLRAMLRFGFCVCLGSCEWSSIVCPSLVALSVEQGPGRSPQILVGQDPSEQDQPSPRGLSLDAGLCRPYSGCCIHFQHLHVPSAPPTSC